MTRSFGMAGTVGLFAAWTLLPSAAAQTARYTVTDLGPAVSTHGLNIHGAVVGVFRGADDQLHGFVAHGGPMADIGSLGGYPTFANAINADGDIVGSSITPDGLEHAFLLREGAMIDLGTLGGVFSHANDLNGAGQIVGDAQTRHNGDQRAFIFEDGRMTDLGAFGGEYSSAEAVNEAGHVVGWAWNVQRRRRAFLWTPEAGIVDLGDLGGLLARADDINDLDHAVGSSYLADGGTHAVLWRDGEAIDLGTLPEAGIEGPYGPELVGTAAAAINNAGQIVGWSFPGFEHVGPFLWEKGVMVNLNSLIDPASGWEISVPVDINDAGQIAATAYRNDRATRAVLLTPVVVCRGDFNADGAITSQDFFDFLTAFFAESESADFDGNGGVDSQDFFAFLTVFFEGCGR